MKLHKSCKVEQVTSDDATRYAITESYLSIKDGAGTLVSTNGTAMAILPVMLDDGDVQGYVSGAAIKAARKCDKRSDVCTVYLNGCAKLTDGSTMPRDGEAKDAQYPNWSQVVPSGEEHTMEIAFDAKMLWELAQAMGTQGVKLRIKSSEVAFLVSPMPAGSFGAIKPACDSAKGILMPISTTGTK